MNTQNTFTTMLTAGGKRSIPSMPSDSCSPRGEVSLTPPPPTAPCSAPGGGGLLQRGDGPLGPGHASLVRMAQPGPGQGGCGCCVGPGPAPARRATALGPRGPVLFGDLSPTLVKPPFPFRKGAPCPNQCHTPESPKVRSKKVPPPLYTEPLLGLN